MFQVGDGQAVVKGLERVAIGDSARVAVRIEEAEPDRQLAKQVQEPKRKNPDPCSGGDTGHSLILDPVAVVDRTFRRTDRALLRAPAAGLRILGRGLRGRLQLATSVSAGGPARR